jgi:hypothetical protein
VRAARTTQAFNFENISRRPLEPDEQDGEEADGKTHSVRAENRPMSWMPVNTPTTTTGRRHLRFFVLPLAPVVVERKNIAGTECRQEDANRVSDPEHEQAGGVVN